MAGFGLQELIRLAKIRKTIMMPVAFLILAARIVSDAGEKGFLFLDSIGE